MALPTHPHLELKHENSILWMSFNQPDKMNALRDDMLDVFCRIVDEIENDDTVHAVVVRGNGPCFSSGYDLTPTDEGRARRRDSESSRRWFKRRYAFLERVWSSPKVFIASVHSYCLAAASDLANTCDITIAAEDAQFSYPAVRWGGHTHRLTYPWYMPMKKAKEMMFTGDRITAAEAERYGMVNRVVPRDKLEEETRAFAERLLLTPLSGLTVNKTSLNFAYNVRGYQQAMQYSFQIAETNQWRPGREEFHSRAETTGVRSALDWRDTKYGDRSG